MLRIGIDLDNTLIDYGGVFGTVAADLGMLPASQRGASKAEVRATLRAQVDGERTWMRLQGQVYGRYLGRARLFPGVAAFFREAGLAGARSTIVSHKTQYGHEDQHRVRLWDAALAWLDDAGFFAPEGFGLRREDVHFEETREAKLARIEAIGCDVFIDDLPEVLLHPAFPKQTVPLWFADSQPASAGGGLEPHRSWQAVTQRTLSLGAQCRASTDSALA